MEELKKSWRILKGDFGWGLEVDSDKLFGLCGVWKSESDLRELGVNGILEYGGGWRRNERKISMSLKFERWSLYGQKK
jgi:hypothetical protein